MYKYYNPNPAGRVVGDCTVRAVSKALGITWEEAFDKLATAAYKMADLPNSDSVWGAVLRGYTKLRLTNCVKRSKNGVVFGYNVINL